MNPLVSIVVPFYNEQDNVRPLYEQIRAVAAELHSHTCEFVFVDDGSTDDTAARLEELRKRDHRVRALHMVRNTGQSAALLAGMRYAEGAFIITLDGDLQNDPADIPKFLELLKAYDCVCGYRVHRRDARVRRISSRIANAVRNAVLQDGIRDAGCGARGLRRHCVEHLIAFNGMHRFVAALLQGQGFSVVEYPVHHRARHSGRSKYGINNRLWRGLFDLAGVAWLRRRQVSCATLSETGQGARHELGKKSA